jgi:hypothetical protein
MLATKLKRCVFIFVILQPFLDIFWLYQPPIATFLGMSPATLIRLVFIAVIGVLYLLSLRNKKELWFYGGYLLLLGVYFIFHQRNAMAFHSLVPGNFGYSTFGELFYIVRMLVPLFMIVVAARTEYTDNQFEHIINWLTIFFSGSIVLTNVLRISLGSYLRNWGTGNIFQQYPHQRITGTIFDWFRPSQTMDFYGMASKGFFNHANTTGAILVLLTPLVFYVVVKNFNWKNSILMGVHLLACQELGTKAAGYGVMLALAAYILVYLFFAFVKKEVHFNKYLALFFVVALFATYGLSRFAPSVNRQASEEVVEKEMKPTKKKTKHLAKQLDQITKTGTRKQQIKFINKYRDQFGLNKGFVTKTYPAKYDPQFWLGVMHWPAYSRMNYRYLQMQIWRRVSAINNNSKDKLFGFGYIRLNNMGLIERDFVSQYYAIGAVGMLLLVAPYILLILFLGLRMLFRFRDLFTLKNVTLIMGVIMAFAISLYAGYVLDYLTATILVGFFLGQLVLGTFPPRQTTDRYAFDRSHELGR